jgi:NADH-quinone oxidoreductase subunit E
MDTAVESTLQTIPGEFKDFEGRSDVLISLLQHFQSRYGYLSSASIRLIATFLKISESRVYGVASFYAQFKFEKPGDIKVRVCQGTACHVNGGQQLSDEIKSTLGIKPGEITPDHRYEFEEVACLGCCAQAPVVEIDGKINGKLTPEQLKNIIHEHPVI